jgi:hypothetical protein
MNPNDDNTTTSGTTSLDTHGNRINDAPAGAYGQMGPQSTTNERHDSTDYTDSTGNPTKETANSTKQAFSSQSQDQHTGMTGNANQIAGPNCNNSGMCDHTGTANANERTGAGYDHLGSKTVEATGDEHPAPAIASYTPHGTTATATNQGEGSAGTAENDVKYGRTAGQCVRGVLSGIHVSHLHYSNDRF